nr:aspyridones efflux protein [Quercus suber]
MDTKHEVPPATQENLTATATTTDTAPSRRSSHDTQTTLADDRRHEEDAVATEDGTAQDLRRVDSEPTYPGPKELMLITTALLLTLFLVALDRTIIATAIPTITDEFDSVQDIGCRGWRRRRLLKIVADGLVVPGFHSTFYTPKYVFLIAITIFEIGSAVCGAAPNSIAFIIGRAIAGLGTAGIQNGAIILVVAAVPLAKRPAYLESHRLLRRHFWSSQRRRPPARWRVHIRRIVAVVFLHQPADRRRGDPGHLLHPQTVGADAARVDGAAATWQARSAGRAVLVPMRHLPVAGIAVRRQRVGMEQLASDLALHALRPAVRGVRALAGIPGA